MNIFSSEAFLEAVADIGFAGQPRSIEVVRLGTQRFRLLFVKGRPVLEWPFLDFFEPLAEEAPGLPTRTVGWLPVASVEYLTAEAWKEKPRGPEYQPSPTIEWARFARWEDYLALVTSRISSRVPDSQRKRRKMEREIGPIRFLFHDERPEVFEQGLKWKSAQYTGSGLKDMFADPRNVELFRRLVQAGVGKVASFTVGDRLMGVHLGAEWQGRFYWWVPSYDVSMRSMSPGRLLMEDVMLYTYQRGYKEFDFLLGEESYKWEYATHTRVVGPLGEPPLKVKLEKLARERVKPVLQQYPRVWERVQALRRRLGSR